VIGELAAQDSQWAAALTAFSPVLVAVAVLAVGGLALWLAYREHAGDSELAEVLVESVTSEHGRLSLGFFNNTSDTPGPHALLPGDTQQVSSTPTTPNDEGGLPF
jgi:hypothetical protein